MSLCMCSSMCRLWHVSSLWIFHSHWSHGTWGWERNGSKEDKRGIELIIALKQLSRVGISWASKKQEKDLGKGSKTPRFDVHVQEFESTWDSWWIPADSVFHIQTAFQLTVYDIPFVRGLSELHVHVGVLVGLQSSNSWACRECVLAKMNAWPWRCQRREKLDYGIGDVA